MKTLRVLHLEDNPRDAELLRAALESERFACHLVQVKSKAAFETAVANGGFDLVLSDYALPGYDGLTALALVRRLRPEVPFILVSGTLGEEQAVDSLKSGATDYVLKSRLNRLVPAMRRALCEAEAQAQRRQAEEKLRQSQKLFRQITENVDDLIAVLDLQGRRVFHSPSYHRVLGRPQSLVGTDSFADIHPEDRERIRRIFFQTVASGSGQRAEYRFVLRDGRVRFIESQGSVIRDNGGAISGVLVVSRDITERKRAEEQIREQVALLDKARDAIMVQDLEGRIRYWNKGAARLYGWTATEAIGQYAEKFLFGEMSAQLRDAIRVVTERGEWTGELTQTTKQGKTVTVEGRWTLLLDAAGHPTANLVINTDVTEKKQIEAQFLRAQRLESIGALASGIAHDLNNILSPIMMSAPMLRWRLKPEEIEKTVTSIETSAQRGAELVKQLLTFGRGVEGKRTLVQPKHLLHEMARMVRETFPKNITVHPHIPGELWPLMGDTTQLHQLLLNLCVNARDAMPHGGTLTISAENASLDEHYASTIPDAKAGPYVVFRLADTGQGIPREIMDKIFDPFFTTKAPGKGTGLGLATVLGIVKSHGGFVDVRSQPGEGSSFTIHLPATPGKEARHTEMLTARAPAGRGELILVVDDEPQILGITRQTLEKNGYRVVVADDGVAAMVLFTERKDEFQGVVTDLEMPFMDGVALVRALKKMVPDIRIVVCTGIGSDEELHDKVNSLRELGVVTFLNKPYAAATLLNALHEALRPE